MAVKKPLDQVRRRNTKLVTNLPPDGRVGEVPEWPRSDPPNAREAEMWADVWELPQAVVWEQWHQEEVVAQYVQMAVRCEHPEAGASMMAQRRLLQVELGMTPKALFGLQWTLAPVESEVPAEATDLDAYREALAG